MQHEYDPTHQYLPGGRLPRCDDKLLDPERLHECIVEARCQKQRAFPGSLSTSCAKPTPRYWGGLLPWPLSTCDPTNASIYVARVPLEAQDPSTAGGISRSTDRASTRRAHCATDLLCRRSTAARLVAAGRAWLRRSLNGGWHGPKVRGPRGLLQQSTREAYGRCRSRGLLVLRKTNDDGGSRCHGEQRNEADGSRRISDSGANRFANLCPHGAFPPSWPANGLLTECLPNRPRRACNADKSGAGSLCTLYKQASALYHETHNRSPAFSSARRLHRRVGTYGAADIDGTELGGLTGRIVKAAKHPSAVAQPSTCRSASMERAVRQASPRARENSSINITPDLRAQVCHSLRSSIFGSCHLSVGPRGGHTYPPARRHRRLTISSGPVVRTGANRRRCDAAAYAGVPDGRRDRTVASKRKRPFAR